MSRNVRKFLFIHSTKSDTDGLGYEFRVLARPIISPDDCDDEGDGDYIGIGIYELRDRGWSAVIDDITPSGAPALMDALRDVLDRLPNPKPTGPGEVK
jgi:hypothetical protein